MTWLLPVLFSGAGRMTELTSVSLFPEALNMDREESFESVKGRLLQKLAHNILEKTSISLLDLLIDVKRPSGGHSLPVSCFIVTLKAVWSPMQTNLIQLKAC